MQETTIMKAEGRASRAASVANRSSYCDDIAVRCRVLFGIQVAGGDVYAVIMPFIRYRFSATACIAGVPPPLCTAIFAQFNFSQIPVIAFLSNCIIMKGRREGGERNFTMSYMGTSLHASMVEHSFTSKTASIQ